MVLIVRLPGVWLALSWLSLSPSAWASGNEAPRYLRTGLGDDAIPLASSGPRRIRTTLDDTSHAAFPVDDEGRLIRITLDDGAISYGRLGDGPLPARRVRTALD
jgi:hypothetical protein